jgi:hypothetical protein
MRRIPMAMVAAVLLALGVAACGGTGDSGSSGDGGGAPVAKGAKLEPANITLWVGFTQRELGVVKDAVKAFEAENPQVKVKVVGGINDDKIIAASRGGKAPDVAQSFSADNAGAFAPHQQRPAPRIEVGLGERERLTDPQTGAPQHDDQAAQPAAVHAFAGAAHNGHDLLDRRRVGGVAHPLVARRPASMEFRHRGG